MAGLPTLTSHQNRVLRLSFFSLGSLVILYVLFTLTSSSPTPEAAVPSSPHSSTSWSSAGSLLGFPPTPYPVWGLGEGGLMATDKGGINYHAGTGEYRWSEDHPWMKGKEHRRVMVASHFTAHEDVYMSLVHTLSSLLPSPKNVRVYAAEFRWGFADIVEQIGLYPGKTYHDPATLAGDLAKTDLFGAVKGDVGKKADMVVLGTCEIDMEHFSEDLFKQYLARPADDKFTLVCIVHNAFAVEWLIKYGADWVKEGALRIMPISDHVKRAFLYHFDLWADTADTHQVGYEYVPVHVHIPVLPLKLPTKPAKNEMLTNAVIQGSFDPNRRDFEGVFQDLIEELDADPRPWGYHPLSSTTSPTTYLPIKDDPSIPPFYLHLAGNGDITVPEKLAHIVKVHVGLSYPDFFALMSSMDVALLAFSASQKGGYFEVQASSSVAMAVMCEVPLLTTHHIRKVYTYTSSPSITLLRPSYLREIAALKVLRSGVWSPPSLPSSEDGRIASVPPGVEGEIEEMIRLGWKRTEESWRVYQKGLSERNREVGRRLLAGM
ncbi:hypothetical protein BDY24DRAFT_385586 [Mrakia frigida]|uniref:uncharacterized protein n=1 Tax=Mrakia frigida TaxID=29902 RepID=UPI003FCC1FE6